MVHHPIRDDLGDVAAPIPEEPTPPGARCPDALGLHFVGTRHVGVLDQQLLDAVS